MYFPKKLSLIWANNVNVSGLFWPSVCVLTCKKKRTRHNCCGGGGRVTGKAVTIFLWSSDTRHKVHQQDRVGMTTVWQDKQIDQMTKIVSKMIKIEYFFRDQNFLKQYWDFFPETTNLQYWYWVFFRDRKSRYWYPDFFFMIKFVNTMSHSNTKTFFREFFSSNIDTETFTETNNLIFNTRTFIITKLIFTNLYRNTKIFRLYDKTSTLY